MVEPLRDGRLCITSVIELARVITPENRADVLPRFFHLSRREAQATAVEIRPAELVPRRVVVTDASRTPPAAPDSQFNRLNWTRPDRERVRAPAAA